MREKEGKEGKEGQERAGKGRKGQERQVVQSTFSVSCKVNVRSTKRTGFSLQQEPRTIQENLHKLQKGKL